MVLNVDGLVAKGLPPILAIEILNVDGLVGEGLLPNSGPCDTKC